MVYLYATPDDLFERLRFDKGRPLLQVANPLAKLQALYDERHALYCEVADDTVDIHGKSCVQAMDMLLKQLQNRD